MLLIIIAWIYISFVCLSWGNMLVHLLTGKRVAQNVLSVYWPFLCLTGMLVPGFIAYTLSIFFPIGLFTHLLILVPVLLYHLFFNRTQGFYLSLLKEAGHFSWLRWLLMASLLFLVLLIGSYTIIHPDTTMYHAPLVKWMESYRAIPGIVLYDPRLGYQSAWFALIALFRFDFLVSNHWVLINSCVVVWFLVFICGQIFQRKHVPYRTIWIALLFISIICWQLVRLTVASASPDFIVVLLICASFYAFLHKAEVSFFSPPFIVLLSCGAIAIKLSAIFILLLPVCLGIFMLYEKKYRQLFISLLIAVVIMIPGSVRSIINAGYPFYPSTAFNFFPVDWKADPLKVKQEEHYISAYARVPVEDYNNAEHVVRMPLSQWVPVWWGNLALTDKCLLISILVLLLLNLVFFRRFVKNLNKSLAVVFLISLCGSVFWFNEFPDPRFGYGFLLSLLFCLFNPFYTLLQTDQRDSLFVKPIVLLGTICILSYSCYRLIHFSQWNQLLIPAGVEHSDHCGFSPVPCNPLPADVELRSGQVQDGFKRK